MQFLKKNCLIIILLIILSLYLYKKNNENFQNNDIYKVYGSLGCPWTVKQIKYFEENNKNFKFVDCDKENCDSIEGYPVTMVNGERYEGYNDTI